MFSWGMERNQWHEIGTFLKTSPLPRRSEHYRKFNNLRITHFEHAILSQDHMIKSKFVKRNSKQRL